MAKIMRQTLREQVTQAIRMKLLTGQLKPGTRIVEQEMAEELPAYLRVLGANERGREILSVMAGTASLPVSASLAELERSSSAASEQARLEALSTDLYQGVLRCPGPCATDYTAPAIWNA